MAVISKVRIRDKEVRKLIQLALTPSKEVLKSLQAGNTDEISARFSNLCDVLYEYHLSSPTQQTETTKGTVFGAYNAITGYFQNVKSYKDGEAKIKSLLFGGTAQTRTEKAFKLCDDFSVKGSDAFLLN